MQFQLNAISNEIIQKELPKKNLELSKKTSVNFTKYKIISPQKIYPINEYIHIIWLYVAFTVLVTSI